MTDLPKRTAIELAQALRERAALLSGEAWETPATVAMMREAADMLERISRALGAVSDEVFAIDPIDPDRAGG